MQRIVGAVQSCRRIIGESSGPTHRGCWESQTAHAAVRRRSVSSQPAFRAWRAWRPWQPLRLPPRGFLGSFAPVLAVEKADCPRLCDGVAALLCIPQLHSETAMSRLHPQCPCASLLRCRASKGPRPPDQDRIAPTFPRPLAKPLAELFICNKLLLRVQIVEQTFAPAWLRLSPKQAHGVLPLVERNAAKPVGNANQIALLRTLPYQDRSDGP